MFHRDCERMLAFTDRTDDEMRSVKVPTLIIVGDRDVITAEHTVQMSKLIEGSRLAILPGTHGSFIGEALSQEAGSKMPELAVGLIRSFLDE